MADPDIDSLHNEAMDFYFALPESDQQKGRKLFTDLDKNGSNCITKEEVQAYANGEHRALAMKYFGILDRNGNGTLEFRECVTLYYLLQSPGIICLGCNQILPKSGSDCPVCKSTNEGNWKSSKVGKKLDLAVAGVKRAAARTAAKAATGIAITAAWTVFRSDLTSDNVDNAGAGAGAGAGVDADASADAGSGLFDVFDNCITM